MIVQIMLGILLANFYEWGIHKYLLHGMGKTKKAFGASTGKTTITEPVEITTMIPSFIQKKYYLYSYFLFCMRIS